MILRAFWFAILQYVFVHNAKYEPVMPHIYNTSNGNCIVVIDGAILNSDFNIWEMLSCINREESLREYMSKLEGTLNIIYIDCKKMIVIRDKYGKFNPNGFLLRLMVW